MAARRRAKASAFLDSYSIDDQMLLKADRKSGKPGIYSGFDEGGDPVLIKFWPKLRNAPDDDLREIWHHEVRQLHRLGGYPDADQCIAPLHQTGLDEEAFYLVLKPGQRRPLAKHLERPPPGSWIGNPRLAANRTRLWRNLRRIADGLEILHLQGLLHRNLDAWSILTSLGDEPDFQLTGFEWSLRLMNAAAPTGKSKALPSTASRPASFLEDWGAFGRLAAQILGIAETRFTNLAIPASDVSETLSVEEARLIRNLLNADPLERLDGEVVGRRIDQILQDLGAEIAGRDPKLHLVVQLGSGALAQRIADASEQSAGVGETDAQRAFIIDDLRERCLLLAIKTQDGFRLALQGGMHPAIARVVSHAFYQDQLKSHATSTARFQQKPCPVLSADPARLPQSPIVVVDMPWVQDTLGQDRVEQFPRWHNPIERQVVGAVIGQLRAAGGLDKPPSLAVLSPYGEQVRRLRQDIDERMDLFPNLNAFRPAIGPGEFSGTVDSFQGNEADVVIVSLVRNNHHGSVRGALGFLSDPRRMNVLLSRARWRTVLIGSIKFLRQVLKVAANNPASPDIGFLTLFLEQLEAERITGDAVIVAPETLMGRAS